MSYFWKFTCSITLLLASLHSAQGCGLEGALQALLNSRELSKFWHIDTFPERAPLHVRIPVGISDCAQNMTKFQKGVIVVTEPVSNNFFDITKLEATDSSVTICYEYAPEGIRGSAKYTWVDGRWVQKDFTLVGR